MRTIATAKVQRNYNCYNVYFNECLRRDAESTAAARGSASSRHDGSDSRCRDRRDSA